MKVRKFWPLDFDQELEIYESPAWDLPGFVRARFRSDRTRRVKRSSATPQAVRWPAGAW